MKHEELKKVKVKTRKTMAMKLAIFALWPIGMLAILFVLSLFEGRF